MPDRFFEDFEPGQVLELGNRTVTEEDILAFAREFDPQPFHVDPEAAKESVFGGLIASGWHTGSIWMRLYVDAMLETAASQGSPGIEELRWLAPVRPGDTLSGRLTVLETTPSERRPDRGTVRIRGEMVNQEGVTVMSMTSRGHFGRRP
ncbi:MAG: MaoC family dehydratase [Actinomycetota bacterium]|nr:MaoC family dehydratase [Actinomycetota bacterium]